MSPVLFVLPLLAVFGFLTWYLLSRRHRDRILSTLLDLADEVEALLDRSQARMQALQAVVGRVPADMAAVAQASLDGPLPVREAKRDLLQHRLWIQQHAATASRGELQAARDALARARDRLAGQLAQLEQAGAELAEATAASVAAAEREPASLRRPADPRP